MLVPRSPFTGGPILEWEDGHDGVRSLMEGLRIKLLSKPDRETFTV